MNLSISILATPENINNDGDILVVGCYHKWTWQV